MKNITMVFVACLSIYSCHKSDAVDKNPPVLTLNTPVSNATYTNGQVVSITGTITDESLHELLISITKDADGSTLFTPSNPPEVHDLTSYNINEKWTPTGFTTATSVTLKVSAEDHSSNITIKTIKFTLQP